MEDQNTEWKESWHDEYLKWVCGFANAQGGTIEIGKNNKGIVVGVVDAAKFLDELPKKIRATMGIIVDVNLRKKKTLEYIVVKVKAYPNAISYRSKYYLRSGSTTQ
jgi:ATP-dependent DNA helicase RecG